MARKGYYTQIPDWEDTSRPLWRRSVSSILSGQVSSVVSSTLISSHLISSQHLSVSTVTLYLAFSINIKLFLNKFTNMKRRNSENGSFLWECFFSKVTHRHFWKHKYFFTWLQMLVLAGAEKAVVSHHCDQGSVMYTDTRTTLSARPWSPPHSGHQGTTREYHSVRIYPG